jgi:hypothetical protein
MKTFVRLQGLRASEPRRHLLSHGSGTLRHDGGRQGRSSRRLGGDSRGVSPDDLEEAMG